MNVAVYPGSFNPMHIGHLSVLRHLAEDPSFDRTYLIVTPVSPFKDGADDGTRRMEEARRVCAEHPELKAVADDIELKMTGPWYTIRTLRALRERESGNSFTLVFGADHLAAIRGWKDYPAILREFGVLVFPREGDDCAALREDLMREDAGYRIRIADAERVDCSSTQIRAAARDGIDTSELTV